MLNKDTDTRICTFADIWIFGGGESSMSRIYISKIWNFQTWNLFCGLLKTKPNIFKSKASFECLLSIDILVY
jgi:hypothetical protein